MAGHQQRSYRYPNLLITVKHETDERLVKENYTNSRIYHSKNNYYPTTIYYNSNHRQKQHFNRPSSSSSSSSTVQRRSRKNDRFSYYNQQPIRPLMEINDDEFNDNTTSYSYKFKQREPKQRDQYRNRKAELDWDHAFDLDQIDLYTTQNDIDNHSLTSMNSSTDNDNSFSSV